MDPILLMTVLPMVIFPALYFFFRLRTSAVSEVSQVADQQGPDKPFFWPANVTLETVDEIIVVLPGSILEDNEVFGSVIQTSSDDTPVRFDPPDGTPAFKTIALRLKPGVQMTLTKSAQVRFESPEGQPHRGETHLKVIAALRSLCRQSAHIWSICVICVPL